MFYRFLEFSSYRSKQPINECEANTAESDSHKSKEMKSSLEERIEATIEEVIAHYSRPSLRSLDSNIDNTSLESSSSTSPGPSPGPSPDPSSSPSADSHIPKMATNKSRSPRNSSVKKKVKKVSKKSKYPPLMMTPHVKVSPLLSTIGASDDETLWPWPWWISLFKHFPKIFLSYFDSLGLLLLLVL